MKCKRCNGTKKLVNVQAKCSDLLYLQHIGGRDYEGYVPEWLGGHGKGEDAGGDYIQFTICRHCGQVDGIWPEMDKTMNQFKSGKVS